MDSAEDSNTPPAKDNPPVPSPKSAPSDRPPEAPRITTPPPRDTNTPSQATQQQHQSTPGAAAPSVFYGPENYSNVRDMPGSDNAKIEDNPLKYLSNTQRGAEMSSMHTARPSSSARVKEDDAGIQSASRKDYERMGMRGGRIGSQSGGGNMNFGGTRIGFTYYGTLGRNSGGAGAGDMEDRSDHESESFDVRMRALESAISESRNRIARLERDIERLEAEIEELQDRVERIEEGILKLEGEEKGQASSDIGEDRKGGKKTGSDASLD